MSTDLTPLLPDCLHTTAAQLSAEFRGVFSPETVTRDVEASYEQLGERPTVGPNFLPVISGDACPETLVPSADLLDLQQPEGGPL